MHTIGEIARKFGVTLRTLRFYQEKGLLTPARDGTTRLYCDEDVERIEKIVQWRAAGISVSDIANLLKLLDRGETDDLRLRVTELLADIEAETRDRLTAIRECRKAA